MRAARFPERVPFGQYHVPDEAAYRGVLEQIDRNAYYTNHGPLAKAFERALEEFLGVEHVVVCTNEALGLAMALKGMGVKGRVLVPALGFPEIAEAVVWAGLEPAFCDVDPASQEVDARILDQAMDAEIGAVVVVEMWGNRCDANAVMDVVSRLNVRSIFYAPDGFATTRDGKRISRPDQPTLFSFPSERLLSTMEGGCLATNDGDLAAALRNIRSSYGAGLPVPVPVTANGRFSELQAGLGLWSLGHVGVSIEHNEALCASYHRELADVDGLTLHEVAPQVRSNHQSLVAVVDDGRRGPARHTLRDTLVELLREDNIDARRGAACLPAGAAFRRWARAGQEFPVAEDLAARTLRLPVGSALTPAMAADIAGIVSGALRSQR